MVLSSAGNLMLLWPNHDQVGKEAPASARASYPTYGEEHSHDVDYNEDSAEDKNNPALEGPAKLGVDQAKPSGSGEGEADPRLIFLGGGTATIAKRSAVLTQAIMLDLAATKQIRLHTPLLDHTQQQAGLQEDIYDYDELDGYTSPGGRIRMDKSLTTVVFIAVAAETPNKLLLKARQEAYEQVTTQAKDLLEKQRKAYEDQCAKMADEHQKCMERMKAESDKMLEEASKVRQEYVRRQTPEIGRQSFD